MDAKHTQNTNFIFFGTDRFSVFVLEELREAGLIPEIIVTAPDRPAGRGQKMQSPDAKKWADENKILVLQPEKLDSDFIKEISEIGEKFKTAKWDFFVTASYGKIIPKSVLEIPELGALNVHPSLLPLYRGASPIESAILDDAKETGVTIMLMDEKMDHGPILNQEFVYFEHWPTKIEAEEQLARTGGQLLARTIPFVLNKDIDEQDQDHNMATFTKKITKDMGLLEIDPTEWLHKPEDWQNRKNFLKIQALNPWPGAYFFIKHGGQEMRIKVTSASWTGGRLEILKVIPEGRKEMSYDDFIKGFIKRT
jgi:methionyl-tRNA formyltransferase